MRETGRRPQGRLYFWALMLTAVCGFRLAAFAAGPVPQSGPATTTVTDTVYNADGSTAQGNLIIQWPAFTTSSGSQVAAGSTSAALASNGTFSVALVPNAGATPAGVYYTVTYQIGPGAVRTEYWIVPTTSPANLAAVRTTPGSGTAAQPVSMEYVNSELATKANDSAVVHLANAETITGTKTFSAAPSVPTPTSSGQAASKGYVDTAVSNVGAGNYLPTAGGTMTGAITLPGNPTSALQAAPKQYVDSGLAAKANLVSGLVPTNELGTGTASAGTCLQGNGTWGACGTGTGNLSTSPSASQAIAQPAGTQFSTNNLANIRYVTASWNWAQTPADNLTTPGTATIHLSPCPLGIDTASGTNYYIYKVYISGTGTAEAAPVIGGTCTPGATSGTIQVTTANAHAAGYTVGSASSGIQEAWNDAWANDQGSPPDAGATVAPYVKLTADTQYNVYASVYLRGRGGILDGAGALVACSTRDRCIYIGTTQAVPYVNHHKLYNLSGTSTVNVDGVQVASVAATSGIYTVTTASTHPFVVGDTVDCEYHATTADQHWSSVVLSVPSSTSFTVSIGHSTFSSGTTFGFCNLLNAFIEDNSDHVALQDVNVFQISPAGMGYFSYAIVNDNDQQFQVERVSNRSSMMLNATANWPIGAFIYERNDQGNNGITYVHNSEFTGVNCVTGGGNGMVVTDTVCQGFPLYGFRYFGGLQPATFENIYEESTGGTANPLYGYAAQDGFLVQGGVGNKILGSFPLSGYAPGFATGGGSAAERSYFVVPRSSTLGYGPVLFAGWAEPTNGIVNIPVAWPSVELQTSSAQSLGTLTWDVLVTTGVGTTPPWGSGMYAIATNISASCGTNGMCSFTDTQAAPTSYTVQPQQFQPVFWFWPNNLAINGATTVQLEQVGADPQAVASQGTLGVSIVAEQCRSAGVSQRRTPIWVSCLASDPNGGSGSIASLLQEQDQSSNGPATNSKGRLNFGKAIGTPNDLITLQDSNIGKTLATSGQRPSNDAGDMAIGLDQSGGMTERAATSISEYIDAAPSGTNWLERLTATGKTFNVPVTVNGGLNVASGTVTLPVTGSGSQCLHASATGVVSGTGADCGSGSGGSGTVGSGAATQMALYSGSGTAVSGDSNLTDNGTTLSYLGTGGISTPSATVSGNLNVNGQLLVAGPWQVSSPIPGTAMSPAATGTSSLGISNDGNFYISVNSVNGGTPEKVATSATSSYFSNLEQEDGNDLGEYATPQTTAQNFHVYSTYTNSTVWQRTSIGYDPTDNLAVIRSENSTPGSAIGLGFWIGSSARWEIDATSTLKPLLTNSINVGSPTFAPQTIYAATSFDTLTGGRLNFELCNDGTTGTSLNFLAIYNGATPACAVKAGSSNTDGVIGIVSNGSGTSGNAVITYRGYVPCSFDGSTTTGDFVVASTSNPGDCHDTGSTTRPFGVQVLGRSESTNTGVGTYGMRLALDAPAGAPVASPAFTGTPTAPTPATSDDSTKIATTAYVQNQNYLENTGFLIDPSLQTGTSLDQKLNAANAVAITSGVGVIDARSMGGTQTIASQVNIGQLLAPTATAVTGTSPGAGTYKVVYTLTSPTATETSASSEATVTVTGSQAIQVVLPTYVGTATSYNVYVTAAGGASWTESKCSAATNLTIGTTATITAACGGATVSQSNRGFGVALIAPHVAQWQVSIVDSVANTSCGLRFFDQSSFNGDSAGEGRPFSVVSQSSSTNVEALICTDNNPKYGGSYYKLTGLSAINTGSDHVQTAVIVLEDIYDVSNFDDIEAVAETNIPALWVRNACCGTHVSGNLEANSVGEPLKVGLTGVSTRSVTFSNISAVHPASGNPAIEIVGTASDIHFAGVTYTEGAQSGSCADAVQMATGTNVAGPITFDDFNQGAYCSGTTSSIFSVPSTYTVGQFVAHSTSTGHYTNLFKYSPNTALNVTSVGTNETYPELTMDNNNPKTVLTNFQVVGTATLASPVLTGTPTAPTKSADTNNTDIATTAYVDGTYLSNWLPVGTALSTTTGIGFNSTTNHAVVFGLVLRGAVLTSQVSFYLVGADTTGTNTYDIGLYQGTSGSSDNLLVHTGAVTASSYFGTAASFVTIPWTAGSCSVPCVLPPGRYYLALYANETTGTATIGENSTFDIDFYHLTSFSITPASGALPTSITGPTDSLGTANYPYLALH